ncbi:MULTISPECIES: hypothetical protein [Halomonas]|uniref:hypothetical protein n=1 Tax=unclassified Halomonas TaxID=2609666 RepID=UPI001C958773|nr:MULTISPECIES: hypothetical protein [Halomonas]MBY6209060.1 hypothetical protein [Halomonas sp. DP3Y7-2]MBY6229215.1 hypothetical protein [Halomonas sp. DP3Y7-1]MCA0917722.1 hypothetical protein [Halomonas denitrificans]
MDTSELDAQFKELQQGVESLRASLDRIANAIDSHLPSLGDDIIFGELSTTVDADGTCHALQRLSFGRNLDVLTAALWALE